MAIRILGLNCSPRPKGNSEALLRSSLRDVADRHAGQLEYEVVNLRECRIEHCHACDACGKAKEDGQYLDCILAQQDDVQDILDKMVMSHGIAVATPVYFGLPTDLFSRFIMRTRVLRHQDFALANRVVGVMAVAGRRSGGGETAILSTWLPFIRNGCIPVGNGDATCQIGALGWAGPRGQVLTDQWGMEQGVQLIERIYHVAKLIQTGIQTLDYQDPMAFSYTSGTRGQAAATPQPVVA